MASTSTWAAPNGRSRPPTRRCAAPPVLVRKARPRPGPGMGLGTKPPTWPVRALQPRRARATRSDQRPEASNKKTDGPITSRRPRPQGNVFSVCIVRMRQSAENTRIFSVLESAGERMVHHWTAGSRQTGKQLARQAVGLPARPVHARLRRFHMWQPTGTLHLRTRSIVAARGMDGWMDFTVHGTGQGA